MTQHSILARILKPISAISVITDAEKTWQALSDNQRHKAIDKLNAITPVLDCYPEQIKNIAKAFRISGVKDCKKHRTALNNYLNGGVLALVSKHKGRELVAQDWHVRYVYYRNLGNGLSDSAIHLKILEEGFKASYFQVSNYGKSLGSSSGKHGVSELGRSKYDLTEKPYKIYDHSNIKPGDWYQADGNKVDVYMLNPNSGKPYRPELTMFEDVKSRKIVGWHLDNDEATKSTIFALSHAINSQNHIPLGVHMDNGPGFKAKVMNDENIGFYKWIMGNNPRFAIAGRPTGKGKIERIFGTINSQHHKTLPFYCGAKNRSFEKTRQYQLAMDGKPTDILTFEQYQQSLATYIDRYNNQPHKSLNKQTPNQVWDADFERFECNMDFATLMKQREYRTVQRSGINFRHRLYRHADLIGYNHKQVIVEYDQHTYESVDILDKDGRKICTATEPQIIKYSANSENEKRLQGRLKNRLKANTNKRYKIEAEENHPIDGQIVDMQNIGAMDALPIAADDDLIELDISQLSTE